MTNYEENRMANTVTITAEEYRSLIEEKCAAQADARIYQERLWRAQGQLDRLEKKVAQ